MIRIFPLVSISTLAPAGCRMQYLQTVVKLDQHCQCHCCKKPVPRHASFRPIIPFLFCFRCWATESPGAYTIKATWWKPCCFKRVFPSSPPFCCWHIQPHGMAVVAALFQVRWHPRNCYIQSLCRRGNPMSLRAVVMMRHQPLLFVLGDGWVFHHGPPVSADEPNQPGPRKHEPRWLQGALLEMGGYMSSCFSADYNEWTTFGRKF